MTEAPTATTIVTLTLNDIWPTLGMGKRSHSNLNYKYTKKGPGRRHRQGNGAKAVAEVQTTTVVEEAA